MPCAGVLVLPLPERSPPCLTQNPLVGSSWDYKIRRTWSGDVRLPRLSATSCPRPGRNREQGRVSFPGSQQLLCHAPHSSPS